MLQDRSAICLACARVLGHKRPGPVAPHAPALPSPRVRRWASALGLLALTLLAWGAVPGGAFQFDDRASALVQAAPGVRIRPLLALTWAADRAIHGERAARWLAENLVLHCLTVLVAVSYTHLTLPTTERV